MESNKILLFGGGIVLTLAFLVGAYFVTSKPAVTYFPELNKVQTGDNIKWSDKNKIILVEYSDFQCPACQAYWQMLESLNSDKEFVDKVQKNVTFVYRQFPLDNIHKNTRTAGQAAEAAAMQGKFFPMHDMLFENQKSWELEDNPYEIFKQYAKDLQLDLEKFEKDYNAQETKDKIENQYKSGITADVKGTPTFFLNGNKLDNPRSAEEFKKILLDAVAK